MLTSNRQIVKVPRIMLYHK